MSWYALYIKPRNEKKVAQGLASLGIEVYCPMVTEYRQWSDRVKKVEVPLINSYLFVNIDDKDRPLVFQVAGAVRYVFWLGKPAVVRHGEIEIMKEWLKNDLKNTKVEQLQSGDAISVPHGPFKGQDGIVHEVGKNRIQILLKALGLKITLSKI